MFRVRVLSWIIALDLLIFCAVTSATTVLRLNLDDMLLEADFIIEATVVDIESRWVGELNMIYTFVTFDDVNPIHGELRGGPLTLRFEGGEVEDLHVVTAGIPTFAIGDRELLMLQNGEDGPSPLVGLFQGRFRVVYGQVLDYSGRPVIAIEDNVLVKLGDEKNGLSLTNSPGMSQGFPDRAVYQYRPGAAETQKEPASVGEFLQSPEPPAIWDELQQQFIYAPRGRQAHDGAPIVRDTTEELVTPAKEYSRFIQPEEDVGIRLSVDDFSSYIQQRLQEL